MKHSYDVNGGELYHYGVKGMKWDQKFRKWTDSFYDDAKKMYKQYAEPTVNRIGNSAKSSYNTAYKARTSAINKIRDTNTSAYKVVVKNVSGANKKIGSAIGSVSPTLKKVGEYGESIYKSVKKAPGQLNKKAGKAIADYRDTQTIKNSKASKTISKAIGGESDYGEAIANFVKKYSQLKSKYGAKKADKMIEKTNEYRLYNQIVDEASDATTDNLNKKNRKYVRSEKFYSDLNKIYNAGGRVSENENKNNTLTGEIARAGKKFGKGVAGDVKKMGSGIKNTYNDVSGNNMKKAEALSKKAKANSKKAKRMAAQGRYDIDKTEYYIDKGGEYKDRAKVGNKVARNIEKRNQMGKGTSLDSRLLKNVNKQRYADTAKMYEYQNKADYSIGETKIEKANALKKKAKKQAAAAKKLKNKSSKLGKTVYKYLR